MIIRASSAVKEGSILVDSKGRRACKVFEIIGSVSSPYISAQPLTDRIQRIEGEKLFVGEIFEKREKHGFEQRGKAVRGRDRGRGRWEGKRTFPKK